MSDSMSIEPGGGSAPSFSPPITPTLTGSPGADKYLQSDAGGVVGWAPKPTPGPSIPAGTGWVKQTAPGTFASIASVPAPQVSYSPSVPASWPIVVTEVDSALNSLEAQITSLAGFGYTPAVPSDWVTSPASLPTGLDLLAEAVGRPIDFAKKIQYEEFSNFATTGSLGIASSTSWQVSTSGTGTAARAANSLEVSPEMAGALTLATGTTATGRAGVMAGPTAAIGALKLANSTTLGKFDIEFAINIPVAFTATDSGWFMVGLNSAISASTPGANGVFWRYDGGLTQQFSAVIRSNHIETGSALSVVTLVPGTTYRLRVTSDGINVKWRLATGREGGTFSTYLTLAAATFTTDAFWAINLVSPVARIQKSTGTTNVIALVDRYVAMIG